MPDEIESGMQRLARLLVETGSFQYSPDKPFQLSSGATSPYYFDLKRLCGNPEGISLVAQILYHFIRKMPGVESVGGLAVGSISIATAVSQYSWLEHQANQANPLLESFFVRKEQKTHGTSKKIEGCTGSTAVILDDVITSGASAIAAVEAVHDRGIKCTSLLSVIFRGTPENRREIERRVPLSYIFHKDQLVERFKEPKT